MKTSEADTPEELIENMSNFLLEEPDGKFQVGGWHKSLRSYELEKMAEFSNKFDDTHELTLIYLAQFCQALLDNTACPVMEALTETPQLSVTYSGC